MHAEAANAKSQCSFEDGNFTSLKNLNESGRQLFGADSTIAPVRLGPHRIAPFWFRIALDIRIKHSIRLKPTTPSASPPSSFPVLPPPFFPVFVARLPTSHDAELRPLFLVSQRARRHFTGVLGT
jgi:hypothetical protein